MSGDAGVFPWYHDLRPAVGLPVYIPGAGTGEGLIVYCASAQGIPADPACSGLSEVYGSYGNLQGRTGDDVRIVCNYDAKGSA